MAVHLPKASFTSQELADIARASEILERVLPHFDVVFQPREEAVTIAVSEDVVSNSESYREKIKSATSEKAISVPEIEKRTGLKRRKIWGVLSAPDLVFRKIKVGKETHYQFEKAIPRLRTNPNIRPTHNPGYLSDNH